MSQPLKVKALRSFETLENMNPSPRNLETLTFLCCKGNKIRDQRILINFSCPDHHAIKSNGETAVHCLLAHVM
jgi:hypothetical protein